LRDFSNDHTTLALNTATLGHNVDSHGAGWSPKQVIDGCAARGYGGIVFWRREIGSNGIAIGEYARSAGLKVVGLCRTPFLVGSLAPNGIQAIMDDAHASIDIAAALGAPILTIVVGGVEPGTKGVQDSLKLVGERVATLAPYAAERGVKLALEPLNPVYGGNRSCLTTVRDAVDLLNLISADNVGLAIDVYHVWWDTDLRNQLKRVKPSQIYGYHLCDWLEDTRDTLLDRGMMGDGVADLRNLRATVEGAGYNGLCEVEIFSAHNWWKRDPNEVLDTVMERYRSHC